MWEFSNCYTNGMQFPTAQLEFLHAMSSYKKYKKKKKKENN